ncbi:MAG: hypothetical protein QNJ70_28065 [Xenococcaceae cyanobacterium MO_207.B15]|nr:hypothetical protein [Xenococcaceae cyanobacterium MO_207.B15]
MPKSFWENPIAHELEVAGTHVNTPIYGYCGLDLDEECDKFRACYTCRFFVAKPEKKLVDPNKLKKLSNIFNKKND